MTPSSVLQSLMTAVIERLPRATPTYRRMAASTLHTITTHSRHPPTQAQWVISKLLSEWGGWCSHASVCIPWSTCTHADVGVCFAVDMAVEYLSIHVAVCLFLSSYGLRQPGQLRAGAGSSADTAAAVVQLQGAPASPSGPQAGTEPVRSVVGTPDTAPCGVLLLAQCDNSFYLSVPPCGAHLGISCMVAVPSRCITMLL